MLHDGDVLMQSRLRLARNRGLGGWITVADLVADVRASTPTRAASLIVDIQKQARDRTERAMVALIRVMEARREQWRRRFL